MSELRSTRYPTGGGSSCRPLGALAEVTIPARLRWIPKGMELEYLAMSDSTLVATAETDPADWERPGEVAVRVRATREDATVVVRGVIRLHTSERPRAGATSADT